VDDGDPDLLLEVGRVGEVLLEREPEEADLVRARGPVGRPFRAGHPFVQAVQGVVTLQPIFAELGRCRLVLDDDCDLGEALAERRGYAGKGTFDESLERIVRRPGQAQGVTRAAASLRHGGRMVAAVDVPTLDLTAAVARVPPPDPAVEPDGFVVTVEPNDRIHFLDWGGPGAGVLLIHGLSSTAWSWISVARRLCSVRRTVAMDLRGHGLSDAPTTGYDPATLADDAVAVADGSGLLARGPVVLAGHGFGAIVAAWTAAHLGARCAGLVLVDGGWEDLVASTGLAPDEFLRDLDEPPEVLRSMTAYLADREAFDPATWDSDQERAARAAVVELPAGRVVPSSRPHAIAGSVAAMFAYRPAETLATVTAPITALVAAGDEDGTRTSSLDGVQRSLAGAGRPPIRVAGFPNDGHNLLRHRPAEVTAAILAVAADPTR
jgi:pimeloyl-ACP methyl ester carboxylesterase